MEYLALLVSHELVYDVATSALPGAHVREEAERHARPRRAPLRRAAAEGLRSLADRLEPSAS